MSMYNNNFTATYNGDKPCGQWGEKAAICELYI